MLALGRKLGVDHRGDADEHDVLGLLDAAALNKRDEGREQLGNLGDGRARCAPPLEGGPGTFLGCSIPDTGPIKPSDETTTSPSPRHHEFSSAPSWPSQDKCVTPCLPAVDNDVVELDVLEARGIEPDVKVHEGRQLGRLHRASGPALHVRGQRPRQLA